ncbi:hypothetical protein AB0O52_17530 [Arthrobacter sp. NPDC080073]|uniref:hypothetical protein n=1 Tax=Arthrobacter sp. NPDC080073 TaxID=3155919 RepID=UPI0034353F00
MKITIDGNDVELAEPDDGDIITDVVILRRAVTHGDNGKLADSLYIDNTPQTTSIVQRGMIAAAKEAINRNGIEDE